MKRQYLRSRSINRGTTFLHICLPTLFSERGLRLHVLKLPGRPGQGPLSVLGKVCLASRAIASGGTSGARLPI